jgi:hypothetical protein
VRDAGYKRRRVQFDDRNHGISAAGKFEHAGNYHRSAGKCKYRDCGIGKRESLPDRADDESTDSEMNSHDDAVKAHVRGPFLLCKMAERGSFVSVVSAELRGGS